MAWDIDDPLETREPWDYMKECKDQICGVVYNTRNQITMLGQVLQNNPSTEEIGVHLRRESSRYPSYAHAVFHVIDRIYHPDA